MAASSGSVNYYAVLGVSRSASAEEIRVAYHMLLMKGHPRRWVGGGKGEEEARRRARFQEIQQAYKVLSDPTSRAAYDARLQHDPKSAGKDDDDDDEEEEEAEGPWDLVDGMLKLKLKKKKKKDMKQSSSPPPSSSTADDGSASSSAAVMSSILGLRQGRRAGPSSSSSSSSSGRRRVIRRYRMAVPSTFGIKLKFA